MVNDYQKYDLFFEFIQTYSSTGFKEINRNDHLILKLEEMMENNQQYFYIADMIRMKIEFTSQRSYQMLGIKPADLTPYHFKEATHPDDLNRNELGLAQLFKIAHELFVAKKGEMLISSTFRFRKSTGEYSNQLSQCYLFYMAIPNDTVYMINIKTDIEWCKRLKHGYHYYLGNDLNYFRYPDQELLRKGNIFTYREMEVIGLIEKGLNSEQIAEKIFISPLTVNKHRGNILAKSGKSTLSEVIHELKEYGMM